MDENKELVRRIQQGEDLFDVFVKKNEGLIYGNVHKAFNESYCKGIIDYEDACNLALYHAYKAILKFDFSKNLSVSTYLTPCIYYGIKEAITRPKKKRDRYQFVYIDDEIKQQREGKKQTWHDQIEQHGFDDYYHLISELDDVVSCFTLTEQQVFFMYCIEGRVQSEIGELLGVSQVKISRTLTKIREKLKKYYH